MVLFRKGGIEIIFGPAVRDALILAPLTPSPADSPVTDIDVCALSRSLQMFDDRDSPLSAADEEQPRD